MENQPKHNLDLFDSQLQAYDLLESNKVEQLLFGGGAGGGKSYFGCTWVLLNAVRYVGSRGFIGRNELKRLKQTTLLTLFEVFRDNGLKVGRDYKYNDQSGVITLFNHEDIQQCSTIYLLDLAYQPSDPNYDRIGSTQYTYGFIDEAQEITRTCLGVLSARMRYLTADFGLIGAILMSCNPSKNFLKTDFYDPWRKGTLEPTKAFVPSLYKDNIFGDPNYGKKLERIPDPVIRARLKDGNWDYEDDPNQLIPFSWLDSAYVKELPNDGRKRIAVDVAREGSDKTVMSFWIGNVLADFRKIDIPITDKTDISKEIAKAIIRYAKANGVGYRNIIIDAVGVGGGVVDAMRGLAWYVQSFKGGASVTRDRKNKNKEVIYIEDDDEITNYANLRSYSYWIFRMALQKGHIKIYQYIPNLEDFIEEITNQKYQISETNNEVAMEKKENIKKRIGRSPDFADSATMGFYCPQARKIEISFAG